MVRWLVRQTLVLLLVAQGASAALLDTGYVPIYREDFVGETAFPTTPELDPYGMGGLEVIGIPSGADFTVTLDPLGGCDVEVGLLGIAWLVRESSGVPAVPDTFGARGVFSDFAWGTVESQAGITLETAQGAPQGLGLTAALFMEDGVTPVLVVAQATPTRVGLRETDVDLLPAQTAAILAGDLFSIDLLVDLTAGEATASLSVNGLEVQTPVADISALGLAGVLGLGHLSWNYGMTSGISHRVRIHQLEGFVPLPEPSGALVFGACAVVGLANGRRRALRPTHRAR